MILERQLTAQLAFFIENAALAGVFNLWHRFFLKHAKSI